MSAKERSVLFLVGALLVGCGDDLGGVLGGDERSLEATSPNGDEVWVEGESHDITWKAVDIAGDVEVHYSTDRGTSYPSLIDTVPATDGSYTWTVPAEDSTQCRVRVREAGGGGLSDASDADFTIWPPNDPPTADDQTVDTYVDNPVDITLTATDPEADPLTWTVDTQPANGTLTGTPPDLVYTPDTSYTGSDSFTFHVFDGRRDSNTATVTVNISSTPPAPVAAFSASPTAGLVSLDVTFTDESMGVVASWAWNFGDGSPVSSAQSPVHTYGATGTYTVTLTATGPGGPDDEVKTDYVFVGDTVYVDDTNGDDGWDGLTWGTAAATIQKGLDLATDGITVFVAEGTYVRQGSDTVLLTMKDGVSIYGGFAGTETAPDQRDLSAHVTTLDGETLVYHVVVGASNATLDGFTIKRGNANGGGVPANGGGGMLNQSVTNLSVAGCTFVDNAATRYGAGMFIWSTSSVSVVRCKFLNNTCGECGGGISNSYYCTPSIVNCLFQGNSATTFYGGAISNHQNDNPSITNCTFTQNTAGSVGGAIYSSDDSNPTITNSILWGDTAPSAPEIYRWTGPCNVSYTDIQGGYAGTGNIDVDPRFVDAGNGDYHLQGALPCVDGGDNSLVPGSVTTDLDGNPRYVDGDGDYEALNGQDASVDMGAYEAGPYSFGVGGVATYDSGAVTSTFTDVAFNASGEIFAIGYRDDSGDGEGNNLVLVKFFPNGVIDTSFGNNGVVIYNNPNNEHDVASFVEVDSSGRIYAGGYGRLSGTFRQVLVWRFTPDGALDTSYSTDGIAEVSNPSLNTACNGMAMEPDGTVYVSADRYGGPYAVRIYKFGSDGSPDGSFGGSGYYEWTGDGWTNYGRPLNLLGGSLYVAVRSYKSGDNLNCWGGFFKLSTAGVLDTSFASSGWAKWPQTASPSGTDYGTWTALCSDGSFVHTVMDYPALRGMVAKYTAGGALDATFASSGSYMLDPVGQGTFTNRAYVDTSGRIYVSGWVRYNGTDSEVTLFRLLPGGTLDTGYGNSGYARYASDLFLGSTASLRRDGEMVTCGNIDGKATLVLFDSDGQLSP